MKVADVVASVRHGLGASGADLPGEGIVSGSHGDDVERVIVCHSPSVAVLRSAAAHAKTLVISREHPFYLHDDTPWSLEVDTALAAANDPVVKGKKRIIEDGRVAIYRLSSIWDKANPKAQGRALASALGWVESSSGSGRKVVCEIMPQPLSALAGYVRDRLEAGHIRVTGCTNAVVRRVALISDFVSLIEARELLSIRLPVDALICAESCEWEAAVYFKDALDISRSAVNVIFAGTQPTMEPGARAVHEWLVKQLDPLPVTFSSAVRAMRSLEKTA